MTDSENPHLGKQTCYTSQYKPDLLFAIPRSAKRKELGCDGNTPFVGHDIWNGYELSWLNDKGKPEVAILQFTLDAMSLNIIESKSLKLYFNSLNNTHFPSWSDVKKIIEHDLSDALMSPVTVTLERLNACKHQTLHELPGHCLDLLDISCTEYSVNPKLLSCNTQSAVQEALYSDLLKSNCLVTGQPDWGSIHIYYHGQQINHEGLLKYIISFRNHNEFHEQCVERIFLDIWKHCRPEKLLVEARYTRRGGIDINPIRASHKGLIHPYKRLARQ